VGSIVELNNARVAQLLGIPVLFVVNGGLGSAFDELSLNRLACMQVGVPIRGVIVNKVLPDKVEQTRDYFGRALKRWDVPLLGVVPDGPYLSQCVAPLFFAAVAFASQRTRLQTVNARF